MMTSCGKRLSFLAVFSIICFLIVSMVGCSPKPIKQGKLVVKVKKVFKGEDVESPYFFSSIIKICKNKDFVYVADWKMLAISILDKELNFIKRIGKKGAGPGEFKIIISDMFCDDSHLYVKTIRDLHIFTAQGEFVRQLTLKFMPYQSYILDDGFLFKVNNAPQLFIKTDKQFNIVDKFYENDYLMPEGLGKVFVGANAYLNSKSELIIMKATAYHLQRYDLAIKQVAWEFKRDVDFWKAYVEKSENGRSYSILGGAGDIFEDNENYNYFYLNSKKEQMVDVYRKRDFKLIGAYKYEGDVRPLCYRPEHGDFLGSIIGEGDTLYLFELVEAPSP